VILLVNSNKLINLCQHLHSTHKASQTQNLIHLTNHSQRVKTHFLSGLLKLHSHPLVKDKLINPILQTILKISMVPHLGTNSTALNLTCTTHLILTAKSGHYRKAECILVIRMLLLNEGFIYRIGISIHCNLSTNYLRLVSNLLIN